MDRIRTIHLEVVDDGLGIGPDVPAGSVLRVMRGMRERVKAGGGELAMSGGPQGGTRVRVTLPVESTPA